jgi:glucose/arabinose dehydrogenase
MRYIFTLLLVTGMGSSFIWAQIPVIKFKEFATGLTRPVDIANAGDGSGRIFIVEQGGLIRIVDGGALLPAPFLDVSAAIVSGGERGLLGLAFHPDYIMNRYFFIYYTREGDGSIAVIRYRTMEDNPNLADAASATDILIIPHRFGDHYGGKLAFGKDGFLYVGTGDGGGGVDFDNNAQSGLSLLGKILRINVNDFTDVTPPLYTIPSTNPYIHNNAVNDEIMALGLRNPWRWSFDRLTGDMWIGDVGHRTREEINFRASENINSPANYGWRCMEGFIPIPEPDIDCSAPANYVAPVFDYEHNAAGGYSITGGYVYRGLEHPILKGYYICIDFATGNIWLIKQDGTGEFIVNPQTVNKLGNVTSFGEAEDGSLYVAQLSSGILYKITTENELPLKVVSFIGTAEGSLQHVSWIINNMVPGDLQILERKAGDETIFKEVARKTATGNEDDKKSKVQLPTLSNVNFYRLTIIQTNGDTTYSETISIVNQNNLGDVFTGTVSGGYINILFLQKAKSIQVLDASGKELYRNDLKEQTGVLNIPLAKFPKGVIFVKVFTGNNTKVRKFLL